MKNDDWIYCLNLNILQENDLKKIQEILNKENNFKLLPHVLTLVSGRMSDFSFKCKQENNSLLREALGDAVHLLGMQRKPSIKEMASSYCIRIKKALFPNGISDHHHQGEKNFYNKMGW